MEGLGRERVRFPGEPVALVVANSEDALAEACELVDIDYVELPGIFDPAEALADGAPAVHAQANLLGEWNIDRGGVDDAFAAADAILDGTSQTQTVDHTHLEPEPGVGRLYHQS